MNSKAETVLEFNKILEMLCEHTTNQISMERAKSLKPTSDFNDVSNMQQELAAAIDMICRKGNPKIGGLVDIRPALMRLEKGGILNTSELLNAATVFRIARTLKAYNDDNENYLDSYFFLLVPDKRLEEDIFSAILAENEIADNASPKLATIRRQQSNAHGKIRESLNAIIHGSKYQKYLQDNIVTIRDGRYVIPVKAENKGDVAGIVHDMSKAGSTVFIEPSSVVEANNLLRELEAQEAAEIERILASLSAMVSERFEEAKTNQNAIADLDLIFAKAKLALKMKGITPKINNRGFIRIEKGRHPLLNEKTVVPISLHLGGDFKTLVITGPNTGGKTVTLKTIGLFCLMVSAGMAVPAADDTDICVFDAIFADIGDEQSIEQSLSTFSSHMTNIVNIINNVTSNSLVLFDELGAGTDPTEGAALAIAILKFTKDMGALTVATTHYSEIKLYALSNNDVENASCEFDVNSLKPTYKLLLGVPGKSNAFAISKKLGLPDFIINNANMHLTEESIHFEDIISNLEDSRKKAESERQTANRHLAEMEKLKAEIEKERQKISQTKEKIIENANREAKKILEQAKKDSDEIIDEIKKAQKAKNHQETSRAITEARTKINARIRETGKNSYESKPVNTEIPKNLIAGNTVEIIDINQTGTVISPPNNDGMVLLQVGIIKMNCHISSLRLAEKPREDSINKSRKNTLRMANIKSELDLRGFLLEDALSDAEKYIDEAYLASMNEVTIIHGKGTGVLRKGIHDMLKRNGHVKNYRLGTYGEGESGVTVVTLKS